MAGERRLFSITVFKDRSGSDPSQEVADGASVDVYFEGGTASETKTLPNLTPTSLSVYDIGTMRLNDTIQVGTAGGTFLLQAITSHTSITALPFSGAVDVSDGDRLVIVSRRPSLFAYDRGSNATVGSGGTLTTNARGYAEAYLEDGNVDVIVSGSGLTTTLYRDRAAPDPRSLRVTDLGAKGDGSTDDVGAITAALQYAGRSGSPFTELVFPSGVYILSSALSLVSGSGPIKLRGEPGATLRPATGAGPTELLRILFATDDITIEGLTFDNPNNTANLTAIGAASSSSTAGATTRLKIKNCTFRDITPSSTDMGIGIALGESGNSSSTASEVEITGCHFEDIAGPAIKHRNGANIKIHGNTFDNVRRSVWSAPTDSNYTLDGLKITDNDMLDQKMSAVLIESTGTSATYPHKDVKITGNTISSPSATSGQDAIYCDHLAELEIAGNLIEDAQGSGINVVSCIDYHVDRNTIISCDEIGIEVSLASGSDDVTTLRISGNIIRDAQEEGIKITDGADLIIESNVIRSWAQATGDIPAIELVASSATPDNNYISGNHCSDNGGSGPGVRIGSGCTDTVVALNYLVASTPIDDNASSGETQVFFNFDGTPGSTNSVPTSMDRAVFRFAEGSVTPSGTTLTIGDDGNYYEVTVAGSYDTVTPVPQAGTVIYIRANLASGLVSLIGGGNINLATQSNVGLSLSDEEGIALLSNGTNWIVVGTRDFFNYNAIDLAVQTDRAVQSTSASTAKPAFHAEGMADAAGGITDSYLSSLHLEPTYTSASGGTVTNHHYLRLDDPGLSGSSPPSLTDAYVMSFDAAAGTHAALESGTTPSHGMTSPDAWVKISINGTEHYIPAYTSISP